MSSRIPIKAFNEIPCKSSLLPAIPFDLLFRGGLPYLHEHLGARHGQLGPIFRERLGKWNMVSVIDTKMIRSVILGQDKSCPVPPLPPAWSHYQKVHKLERGLFFQRDQKWLSTRRSLDKILLDSNKIEPFESGINRIADDFLNAIERKVVRRDSKGFLLIPDISQELSKYSMESIAYMIFGQRIGCIPQRSGYLNDSQKANQQSIELVKQANEMLLATTQLNILPIELAHSWKTKSWRRFEISMSKVMQLSREISQFHMTKPNDNSLVNEISKNSPLETEEITRNMMDFLIASADTSASSLLWSLHLLSQNPKVQKTARSEVMNNGSSPANYLGAFIRESMRLYPPAPFVSRVVKTKSELAGYEIPPGTMLVIPLILTGRMASYFERPNEVLPERWMSSKLESHLPDNGIASIPFGLGSRMCIGRKMATLEINTLLAAFLRRFSSIEPANEKQVHVGVKLKLTTWPDRPIEFKLSPKL